jgi:hypothetical protein
MMLVDPHDSSSTKGAYHYKEVAKPHSERTITFSDEGILEFKLRKKGNNISQRTTLKIIVVKNLVAFQCTEPNTHRLILFNTRRYPLAKKIHGLQRLTSSPPIVLFRMQGREPIIASQKLRSFFFMHTRSTLP